jgi:2'-5' RNA ligase
MPIRTFLAIELPQKAIEKLADFQLTCLKNQSKNIKYVEKQNLHITLKFLGDSEEPKVRKLADSLTQMIFPKPSISVQGIGAFPNLIFPKVLWAGLQFSPELTELFQSIEDFARRYEFKTEEKEFHPHITLARLKKNTTPEFNRWIKENKNTVFSEIFKPSDMILFESRLNSNGPIYTKIQSIVLKGNKL